MLSSDEVSIARELHMKSPYSTLFSKRGEIFFSRDLKAVLVLTISYTKFTYQVFFPALLLIFHNLKLLFKAKANKAKSTQDLLLGLFFGLPSYRKRKLYQKDDMAADPGSQCHQKSQVRKNQVQSGEEVVYC